ncbi:MAG: ATP-dependent DNA helicase RecG [Firmicutes bacterium]|nr:ATP-dependent DNA helicase RecG [Bacillota bacterium]
MGPSRLDEPLTRIPGVGPVRAGLLARLGLTTVGQLLHYPPRRHVDAGRSVKVADLTEGRRATVVGRVGSLDWRPSRRDAGLWIGRAMLTDDDGGELELLWFARGPGRGRPRRWPVRIVPGSRVAASGMARLGPDGTWQMVSAELDREEASPLHTGRLVPEYPLTAGLSQRLMRRIVRSALVWSSGHIPDPLPLQLLRTEGLPGKEQALNMLHFPESPDQAEAARRRLALEELILLRLAAAACRRGGCRGDGWPLGEPGPLVQAWMERLPFTLTAAQRRAIAEVEGDLRLPTPMRRLLQGDVGSGKTAVAAYALLRAAERGTQAALLAPSDILAAQHAQTLRQWFEPLGIPVRLLRGATPRAERQAALDELRSGRPLVVVGTHALLGNDVRFARLSVLVVDEQHRFGVRQRAALLARRRPPHLLVVSATPIPRTLALCVYADLDVSAVDELPAGRLPVDTRWVRPGRRDEVYRFVRRQVEAGRQAFVVFPAIGEEDGDDGAAVLAAARGLVRGPLAGLSVGVVHGRQPPAEQSDTMAAFRAGRLQVLLATSVVEVGVDVPNASVMVIEGADRFGLAQLHQLRGRVGRGGGQAYCFLVADPTTAAARRRLEVIRSVHDGLALAWEDLRLRGPGELLGVRQAGVPDLSPLAWPVEPEVLEEADRWAAQVVAGREDRRQQMGAAPGLWQEACRRFGTAFHQETVLGA